MKDESVEPVGLLKIHVLLQAEKMKKGKEEKKIGGFAVRIRE